MMSRKEFVTVLFITFIVIMIWIVSSIFHAKANVQYDPKIKSLIEPVSPIFDPNTIDQIKNGFSDQNPAPEETPTVIPTKSPIPTPTIIPSPTAEPTIEPTAIPSLQPSPSPTSQPTPSPSP